METAGKLTVPRLGIQGSNFLSVQEQRSPNIQGWIYTHFWVYRIHNPRCSDFDAAMLRFFAKIMNE